MKTMVFHLISVFLVFSAVQGENVAPGISENLYCEGCIATVKELIKLTSKKTNDPKDLVIAEALEKVCKPLHFVSYDYSPPKTVKACNLLLEKHEDDIEAAFVKKAKKELEQEICYKISNACTNVDRSIKPKDSADIDLTTNGETRKVQKEFEFNAQSGTVEAKAKTLSKKDKKSKKPKKKPSSKKETQKDKKIVKTSKQNDPGVFNVDINDPDALEKVLAQVKEAAANHQKEAKHQENKDEL
eukprot:gene9027-9994_t